MKLDFKNKTYTLRDGSEYRAKKTHTITFWINYYSNGEFSMWHSREEADRVASRNRIACLKITRTFTEGEGLEEGE